MIDTSTAAANVSEIERPTQAIQGSQQVNVGDIERWITGVGGGMLTIYGLRNAPTSLPLALLGGVLMYRAATGHCPAYESLGINMAQGGLARPQHIAKSITVNCTPQEAYRIWRNFENLPRFMTYLKEVQVIDDRHSRWTATGPANTSVSWDAEIFLEKENELIAWRSAESSDVTNAGTVRFTQAPGGRGCEVRVVIEYTPPGGIIGEGVARIFGESPEAQIEDALRNFKQIVETGEIVSSATQPTPTMRS